MSDARPRPLERIVDLTVPFYEGMPTQDIGPKFWDMISHDQSWRIYNHTQSRASRVFLSDDNLGTHLDGPLRFDPRGLSIEQVPLERTIRPARLLDLRRLGREAVIGATELEQSGPPPGPGDAAVLWTDHDRRLGDPEYFRRRPQLALDGAAWLVERGVGIVAADFPGLGAPDDERSAAKRALHRGNVLTAEQLCNLGELASRDWHLCVAPIRIREFAGSLLRAVGLVGWSARELVDLSLDLYEGMSWINRAVPTFWTRASHATTAYFSEGEWSYQTTAMILTEHSGTHFDAPFHFDPAGAPVEQVPLAGLVARARILDLTHKQPDEGIGPADLTAAVERSGLRIGADDALVLWTAHDRNCGRSDYRSSRPFITAEGASWIVGRRPAMLATDLVGLDELGERDPTSPVHNRVLRAGIPQVQGLTNLDHLTGAEAYIAAFPLKLVGGTGAPLRAFAALV